MLVPIPVAVGHGTKATGGVGCGPVLLLLPAILSTAAAEETHLVGMAEVWGGLVLPVGEEIGRLSPGLRRLAAGGDWQSGQGVQARLLLDAAPRVPGEAQVSVLDAWVTIQGQGATSFSGRIGVARPEFGVMSAFESERVYWVAGDSAELERIGGFQPESALSATLGAHGRGWNVAAEVGDALPVTTTGSNFAAVEVRARGAWGSEDRALRGGASAAYRLPGAGSSRLLGEAHVEWRASSIGVLLTGLGGTEGPDATPLAGGMFTLAAPVPVGGGLVRSVSFVVGGLAWDPTLTGLPEAEDVPDAVLRARAGVNVRWGGVDSLITGLGFSASVPQDIAQPIGESLSLEAAWRF